MSDIVDDLTRLIDEFPIIQGSPKMWFEIARGEIQSLRQWIKDAKPVMTEQADAIAKHHALIKELRQQLAECERQRDAAVVQADTFRKSWNELNQQIAEKQG